MYPPPKIYRYTSSQKPRILQHKMTESRFSKAGVELKNKYKTIWLVLSDPAALGYLLRFSRRQHNSENVEFWIKVSHFKERWAKECDYIRKVLAETQGKDEDEIFLPNFAYKKNNRSESDSRSVSSRRSSKVSGRRSMGSSIAGESSDDDEVQPGFIHTGGLTESDVKKLSEQLSRESNPWHSTEVALKREVTVIFDTFLADHADMQVCLRGDTLRNIARSLDEDEVDIHVFVEARKETAVTLARDMLPRFLKSPEFVDFVNNCVSTSKMKIHPPTGIGYGNRKEDFDKRPTLDEALSDRILFDKLHKHLASRYCAENLLFVRAVDTFDSHLQSIAPQFAEKLAWQINRFFLLPDSPMQISVQSRSMKRIGLKLARPELGMFRHTQEKAKKSAQDSIPAVLAVRGV